MNKRITEAFEKGKAFIPFITCGDPSLEVTEQLVYAIEEAGADLIELGIPFSDPTACLLYTSNCRIKTWNKRIYKLCINSDRYYRWICAGKYYGSSSSYHIYLCG